MANPYEMELYDIDIPWYMTSTGAHKKTIWGKPKRQALIKPNPPRVFDTTKLTGKGPLAQRNRLIAWKKMNTQRLPKQVIQPVKRFEFVKRPLILNTPIVKKAPIYNRKEPWLSTKDWYNPYRIKANPTVAEVRAKMFPNTKNTYQSLNKIDIFKRFVKTPFEKEQDSYGIKRWNSNKNYLAMQHRNAIIKRQDVITRRNAAKRSRDALAGMFARARSAGLY